MAVARLHRLYLHLSRSAERDTAAPNASMSTAKGLSENYSKAIAALQAALPPENVSTDVDILKKHSQTFGISRGTTYCGTCIYHAHP